MAMPMTETTIEDGGVGRGTSIVNATIDGLSGPYATRTTILGALAVLGTGPAGTTMTRTRDDTADAGRGHIRNMSATAGHGAGNAAGAIPARRPATLEAQVIPLSSRAFPATSP